MAETTRIEQTEAKVRPAEPRAPAERPTVTPAELPALLGWDPEVIVGAHGALRHGIVAIGLEVNRFAWQRLQANLDAARSLLTCTDVATAMQVQLGFLEAATAHYTDEQRTLGAIVSTMIQDSMAPLGRDAGSPPLGEPAASAGARRRTGGTPAAQARERQAA